MGILSLLGLAPKNQPGIYRITNRRTGQFYIGATTLAITERWKRHRYLLRCGIHHNKRLQADWDRCGAQAFKFSVIEVIRDADQVFKREKYWQRLKHNDKCYNPHPDDLPPFMRPSKIPRDALLFAFKVARGTIPKTHENVRAAMEGVGLTCSEEQWEEMRRICDSENL